MNPGHDDPYNLEQENAYYLVQNSVLLALNCEGHIEQVSPSVIRILGYRPTNLVGTSFFDYLHPDDLPIIRAVFFDALWRTELAVMTDFRFRHAQGSWTYLESMGTITNRQGYHVLDCHDITERKRIEEALRQQHEHSAELAQQLVEANHYLEDQVSERTAQLARALAYEAVLKRITDKVRDSLDEQHIFKTAVLGVGLDD